MFSKSKIATLILGITLASTAAFAGGADSKLFLKNAARNGAAEVSLAQLSLRMASNPELQDFSKQLIEDHTATNNSLQELAKADKISLHKDLSPKQKETEKELAKKNDMGRAFDRAYLQQTIEDHQKAIKAYEKQAKNGTDADVRAFASETLPKLKKHLDMAAVLSTKLNAKNQEN